MMHFFYLLSSFALQLFWVYISKEGFYALFLDYFSGDFADFDDYKRGARFSRQIK